MLYFSVCFVSVINLNIDFFFKSTCHILIRLPSNYSSVCHKTSFASSGNSIPKFKTLAENTVNRRISYLKMTLKFHELHQETQYNIQNWKINITIVRKVVTFPVTYLFFFIYFQIFNFYYLLLFSQRN